MDIIAMVTEKAGISETQAKMAVSAVVDHFDEKLPAPIVNQIKKSLGIDAAGMMSGVMGDVTSGKAGDLADMAKGALGDKAGGLADMAGGLLGKE